MSWQDKAKTIVQKLSAESYAQSQKTRAGGKRKRHVPYSIPETAQRLIDALNRNDEELAKSIMMYDYDANRVMGTRDPGRRGRRTKTEHLTSIDWNIRDAKEALVNAVGMNDWRGVAKYTKQIEALELKLRKSEHPSMKRSRGRGMPSKHIAGHRFGRGELPGGAPSRRYEIWGASGETLWNATTRQPQVFYTRAKAEAAFVKLRREHGPLPAGVRIVELTGPESPPHPHRDPSRRRLR